MKRIITECSFCNCKLDNESSEFYTNNVDAMPLCTACGINLW